MAEDSEGFGTPPKPIPLDDVARASSDDAEMEHIGNEVASSVEAPKMEILPPLPKAQEQKSGLPAARNDGELLESNFSSDTNVPQYLHRTMDEWGRIRK